MASVVAIRILLFLYICYSWTLSVDAMINSPLSNKNNLKNILFRHKYHQPSTKLDSNLLEDSSTLLFSSNIERRNVIMPRICYFARISGTGVHQKLCLPYNNNNRS